MNYLRSKLPTFPQKHATVVAGLASEYGYQFGGNKRKSVEKFCYRTNISYTIPGRGDEMTIWTERGRKGVLKYFLTIYLKRFMLYILKAVRKMIINAASLHSVSFDLKVLDKSLKQQCKCQIHENLFKLEAMGIYKKISGTQGCVIQSHIMTAGKSGARNVLMLKNLFLPRA